MASPIERDTESLAVTSSAAPWDGGALPAFVAVNASHTSPPDTTTATHTDSAAPSPQQQGGLLPPIAQLPPSLKRKLQPDHCKDALQDALHSQKQRRLQIVEGYGGSDFRHVSQKRKASEYAGLAPSSRSSKHLLAAADAQLYKKKKARSPSKASQQKALSPAALIEQADDEEGKAVKRTSHHRGKQRQRRGGAGDSLSSSARSLSVQSPRVPTSPPLPSPHISQSLEDSRPRDVEGEEKTGKEGKEAEAEVAPPTPAMALPTMAVAHAQQRRDSSLVHLHTPEVLAPTAPQKAHPSPETATTTTRSSPLPHQGGRLSDLLSPYSDAAGRRETPVDVAELQLNLSLSQASPLRQTPLPLSMAGTPTESNTKQLQKGWLPSFRRISSRVCLIAPKGKEGHSPVSTRSQKQNKAKKKRNVSNSRAESHEGGSEGEEEERTPPTTGRHAMRRVSSAKTLSIVWAQRPQQPTSASHRVLLRRQRKEGDEAESPRRAATRWKQQPPAEGRKGWSGDLRRVRQSGKPHQASTSQPALRQRAAAAAGDGDREDTKLQERDGSRDAQRQVEDGGDDSVADTPPAPPAGKQRWSRVSGGKPPPSVPQHQQQHRAGKQPPAALERLPSLTGFPRSGARGSGEGAANRSVPAGFGVPPRPSVSRSEGSGSGSRGGKRGSQQSNSASSPRGSSDRGGPTLTSKDDVPATSSDRLPELAHTRPRPSQQQMDYDEEEEEGVHEKETQQSCALTLEEVLARHIGTSSGGGDNPTGRSSHRSSLPAGLSNTSEETQVPFGTYPSELPVEDRRDSHVAAGTTAASVQNGQREPSRSRQPFLPTLPNRHSDATVKTNPRKSWKVATGTPGVAKEGVATVVQKFAPLVVSHHDSLFTSHSRAPAQRQGGGGGGGGGVTDLFGHSNQHNARAEGGAAAMKRTIKREEKSGGGEPSEYPATTSRTQTEEEDETPLHQQHRSVPSNRSIPRTREAPKAHGADVGRKDKEGGDATLSLTPPQRPPPRKPRPPQQFRIKKKKAVVDKRWVSYGFAPYMAGMRSTPGGQAKYNPTIAHRRYKGKALPGQKQGNKTNTKKTKKAEEGVEGAEKSVKPAPIDYAALATQRDPLDYLLGRHGFWGESTAR